MPRQKSTPRKVTRKGPYNGPGTWSKRKVAKQVASTVFDAVARNSVGRMLDFSSKSGSKTFTKRKLKGKFSVSVRPTSGTITFSRYSYYNKMAATTKMVKTLGSNTMKREISSRKVQGGHGVSTSTSFFYNTQPDLIEQIDAARAAVPPNQLPIAGAIDQPTENSINVLLRYTQHDLEMVNASETTMHYEIYELLAKKDHTFEPNEAMRIAANAEAENQTGPEQYLTVKPYDSQNFKQYWTIQRLTRGFLTAGQIHNHKSNVYHNRIVPSARIAEPFNGFIGGLTRAIFVVQWGQPVAGPALPVTSAQTDVHYVISTKRVWNHVAQKGLRRQITDSGLSRIDSGYAFANPVSGEIELEETAEDVGATTNNV